jgi:hypothetical protein
VTWLTALLELGGAEEVDAAVDSTLEAEGEADVDVSTELVTVGVDS